MSRAAALQAFHRLLHHHGSSRFLSPPFNPFSSTCSPHQASESSDSSTLEHEIEPPKNTTDVFRQWGCTHAEISHMLTRQPSLLRMKIPSLQSKLQTLTTLGILAPDLPRIITCRPRFLSGRIALDLDSRLTFLNTLFPSKSTLHQALIRNPSLLKYDIDRVMLPCVTLYESIGVSRLDIGRLLLSRSTLFARSTLDDDDKLELIRKTQLQLPKDAAMYKYIVCIIAISHVETIRSKIANLEKFGFTNDEVMGLFARTPNVLTLSVEKVQRNMTFITGSMKLPAHAVLEEPGLVYCNLEKVLKPRSLLWMKMKEMGLETQVKGISMGWAMKMEEKRFLKVFVMCQEKDVANELMEFYTNLKGLRRLGESSRSKSVARKGFPF